MEFQLLPKCTKTRPRPRMTEEVCVWWLFVGFTQHMFYFLAGLFSLLTSWMVFSETLKINRYKGIPDLAKTHQKAFISPVSRGKRPNHIPVGKLVWTNQRDEDRFIQPIKQSPTKKGTNSSSWHFPIGPRFFGHSFHAYIWSGSEKSNTLLLNFETI